MKFSLAVITGLLMADQGMGFVSPMKSTKFSSNQSGRYMAMDMDMPPAAKTDVPVIQASQYGPTDVRYSDFLKLVNADKIEKVTFSADGSQLLGVDVDGTRIKIEALPNDPELLTELTTHKVSILFEDYSFVFPTLPRRFSYCHSNTVILDRLMSLSFLNRKPVGLESSHRASSSLLLFLLDFSS